MRISDWSSDVCSSDLWHAGIGVDHPCPRCLDVDRATRRLEMRGKARGDSARDQHPARETLAAAARMRFAPVVAAQIADRFDSQRVDRKSVVEGKSGTGGVDLGGLRIIKKTKINNSQYTSR